MAIKNNKNEIKNNKNKEYHKAYNRDYYIKNKGRECYALSNLRKKARRLIVNDK